MPRPNKQAVNKIVTWRPLFWPELATGLKILSKQETGFSLEELRNTAASFRSYNTDLSQRGLRPLEGRESEVDQKNKSSSDVLFL